MSAAAGAVMAKGKGGRPPKDGMRTDSGRLSRSKEAPYVPLAQIRLMISAGKAHGRWGSWFGRQTLSGRYSEPQYQAGCRYAAMAEEYRAAIGAPSPSAQAQDVTRVRGREGGAEDEFKVRRAILNWEAAQSVLSPLERYVLDRVVVQMLENEGEAYAQSLGLALDRLLWLWEGKRK